MKIEVTNFLSKEQIENVTSLENLCFAAEGLENHAFLSNEINFDENFPCFYLGYEGDELIAFLTTFIPNSCEAEILAVTHPDYRLKGCSKALFYAARTELLGRGITKVLFVAEPKSGSALNALKGLNITAPERSEYTMSLSQDEDEHTDYTLTFEKATAANRVIFTAINMEAFTDMEPNGAFINTVINSANRVGYVAYRGNVPVGVFSLNFAENSENAVFLYDVAVAKSYRGQGFGRQLVLRALEESRGKKMVLDVDSDNPTAFSLYKSCGFKIDFQVDYYKYMLK